MFKFDQWQNTLTPFLKSIGADEAEVCVTAKRVGASRFANNAISQNQDEDTANLRLRVIRDGRQGVASGNAFDAEGLKAMANRALDAASKDQVNDALLPMLAEKLDYQSVSAFDESTANATPEARAAAIGGEVAKAKAAGFESAGILTTSSAACAIFNSNGVAATHQSSNSGLTMSAFADGGETEAIQDASAMRFADLNCAHVGDDVVERCKRARGAKPIAAGKYDVVLEEAALSDLMLFLGWLGFNSLSHAEGRSGLGDKMGKQVFSPSFSLWADPFHESQQACPFDMEGYATKPLHLIDAGTPKDLPHDRRTAAMMGAENSGYGNSQPDAGGPGPRSLVVGTGDSSLEEMIANTERGLLITSFHYTNAVDPMALSITGMTRGGTWLIENGKPVHAVSNMRFTQSLIEALSNVKAISKDANFRAGGLFGGGMVLPSMAIGGFNFSSETGF